MKNTIGNSLTLTLFGESHGEAIGAVIDGIAPGIAVDEKFIRAQLDKRKPSGSVSTSRREADPIRILSGVFDGKTTGTPICIMIPNSDTHSADYGEMASKARPSHADFTAEIKYKGFQDFRGGGHFSGRITAAIVAAAAIVIPALQKKGIYIGTHIKRCAGVPDRNFDDMLSDIKNLNGKDFAVLDDAAEKEMVKAIDSARLDGDSVGGVLETAVYGMPAGVGEPWFDTLEGVLSHALFSIPAVKGVEFGAGFDIAEMRGAEANDPLRIENSQVLTATNNNGGVLGGISNGMPIIIRLAVKPTPTISREQLTIDMKKNENTTLKAGGRHDPCIVHRARVVADSVTALVLADMLSVKYGTDWLGE